MLPLRLVLDTNIVVSAALKPEGLQRTVLLLASQKPARLYISSPILAEYGAVLARPELRIRRGLQLQLLDFIKKRAHLIVTSQSIRVAGDPGDDIFLECVDEARADYLVTGNLRHFPRFWKSTKVVNTREFIRIVSPHLNA